MPSHCKASRKLRQILRVHASGSVTIYESALISLRLSALTSSDWTSEHIAEAAIIRPYIYGRLKLREATGDRRLVARNSLIRGAPFHISSTQNDYRHLLVIQRDHIPPTPACQSKRDLDMTHRPKLRELLPSPRRPMTVRRPASRTVE